jgi:hypothetical protein
MKVVVVLERASLIDVIGVDRFIPKRREAGFHVVAMNVQKAPSFVSHYEHCGL